MESINSLKSYWRRQAYQRLEDVPSAKKMAVARLGGGGKRWRRVRPAMSMKKLSVPKSPEKVMVGLRDAYMNVMLMLAGDGGAAAKKEGCGGGGGAVWDRRIPRARQGSLRGGDFEKRVVIHLYNSVIATR